MTEYRETFGINDMSFSPTIYEMLKRYQFIKEKNWEYISNKLKEDGIKINVYTNNENLKIEQEQLLKYDEIPMMKDSMFESLEIVRYAEQI